MDVMEGYGVGWTTCFSKIVSHNRKVPKGHVLYVAFSRVPVSKKLLGWIVGVSRLAMKRIFDKDSIVGWYRVDVTGLDPDHENVIVSANFIDSRADRASAWPSVPNPTLADTQSTPQ